MDNHSKELRHIARVVEDYLNPEYSNELKRIANHIDSLTKQLAAAEELLLFLKPSDEQGGHISIDNYFAAKENP